VGNVGNPGQANEVAADWDENVTYNNFGNPSGVPGGDTPGVQAGELGASLASATGDPTGFHSLDVTASLMAWAADPSSNRGWIVQPTGSNGVRFWSSERSTIADRPQLTVEYANPIVTRRLYPAVLARPGLG
jgi:hypothetical protein